MTAWYEMPNSFQGNQSVIGYGTWLRYADYVTGGYLAYGIIIAIFAISFMAMKNYPSSKAMAASSFITTIMAIMLSRILTFNPWVIYALIGITIVSILISSYEKAGGY